MAHKEEIKRLLTIDYRTKRNRANYEDLRDTQKFKYKKDAKEIIEIFIDSLNSVGFRIDTLILKPKTGDPTIDKKIPLKVFSNTDGETEITTKEVLIAKDQICLSDKRYHNFRRNLKLKALPTLFNIKKKRKELNGTFETTETAEGAYFNIEEKMKTVLRKMMNTTNLNDNDLLKIKYSGDGTVFGRVIKNLNVTFTILNEGNSAKTASGNYLIGTFKIKKEDYETVEKCMQGLIAQIEELNEIVVDNKTFKIQKYFCGDLKFMAIMLGINAANSNQPCLWCTYNAKKSQNDEAYRKNVWSIIHREHGARTIEEAVRTVREKLENHNGYIKLPLIRSIPIHRYVIDMLHLFLRITDKLLELFYANLQTLDAIDGFHSFNLNENSRVKTFLDHLTTKFKVYSPFHINKDTYELRSFRGPEKERIFANITLSEYARGFSAISVLQKIWSDFWNIYTGIKQNTFSATEVKHLTSEWMTNFRNVYHEHHVTPYMHCFEQHLHEFIQNEQDVNQFNQQGFEKMNSLMGFAYDHGTNKLGSYCKQLINRQNRIDIINSVVN